MRGGIPSKEGGLGKFPKKQKPAGKVRSWGCEQCGKEVGVGVLFCGPRCITAYSFKRFAAFRKARKEGRA